MIWDKHKDENKPLWQGTTFEWKSLSSNVFCVCGPVSLHFSFYILQSGSAGCPVLTAVIQLYLNLQLVIFLFHIFLHSHNDQNNW